MQIIEIRWQLGKRKGRLDVLLLGYTACQSLSVLNSGCSALICCRSARARIRQCCYVDKTSTGRPDYCVLALRDQSYGRSHLPTSPCPLVRSEEGELTAGEAQEKQTPSAPSTRRGACGQNNPNSPVSQEAIAQEDGLFDLVDKPLEVAEGGVSSANLNGLDRGRFNYIPNKSNSLKRQYYPSCWIWLISFKPVEGRARVFVVVVVPAFTESKNGNKQVVLAVIFHLEVRRPEGVANRVHGPCELMEERGSHTCKQSAPVPGIQSSQCKPEEKRQSNRQARPNPVRPMEKHHQLIFLQVLSKDIIIGSHVIEQPAYMCVEEPAQRRCLGAMRVNEGAV